jgi:hypothetical protein
MVELGRALISATIAGVREHLAALLALGALACAAWLLGLRGLDGPRRRQWVAVPALLLVAVACLAGPGRLFPKVPWEGPNLVTLSSRHALTLLDVPGLLCAALALALAARLLAGRRPPRPASRR